ncbi:MAG: NAD(P)/FAD-dependent oxidoreductase [Bacteroidales bacterium]|nr:NAD(P)/FAD-dependent oxidoreductase [Bacteroidales bacterium]
MEKFDVVIIGSGLGGLTAGATLANKGKKVLVIEQHYSFGGCATNFKRKGCEIDASLHLLDGLGESDSKFKIFQELGVFKNVELLPTPEFYNFTSGDTQITIPYGYDAIETTLINKFPEEEKSIKKFIKVVKTVRNEIDIIAKLPKWKRNMLLPFAFLVFPYTIRYIKQNVGDFLDSITKNEKLKLTLAANIGFYHDDPYKMSLVFFCSANGSFYRDGGYYIKGGSQKLSDYFVKIITDNGGVMINKHLVSSVLTDRKKAIGVEYHPVNNVNDKKQAFGEYVIANANIPDVAKKLLPEKWAKKLKKKIRNIEIGPSILCVYLIFNKESKELGGKNYSIFNLKHDHHNLKDYRRISQASYDERPFLYTDYGAIDSQLAAPGKNCATICTLDYLEDWETLDEETYKKKKEMVAQILIDRLEQHVPNIREHIEHYEVGTPRTIKRYIKTPNGAIYGYAQMPLQALNNRIKYQSPLKNLFFSSAWNFPGGGFAGAIASGWNCAKIILKKEK